MDPILWTYTLVNFFIGSSVFRTGLAGQSNCPQVVTAAGVMYNLIIRFCDVSENKHEKDSLKEKP